MKICPRCNTQLDDNAVFCSNCGNSFAGPSANANTYTNYAPPAYDHTREFAPEDISQNKVYAMLVYLLGSIGIIIALIASGQSPYTKFHVTQALKFAVTEILFGIVALLLIWTFIVPIAYAILMLVYFVLKIICFFQICSGKAIEPPIIRSLGFLK